MSEEILNQEAESPAVEEDQLQESQVEETVEVSEDETLDEMSHGKKKGEEEEEHEESVQKEEAPKVNIPKTKAGTIQAAVDMLKAAKKEDAQRLFAKMIKVDEAEEEDSLKSSKDAENMVKPKSAKAPVASGAGDKHGEVVKAKVEQADFDEDLDVLISEEATLSDGFKEKAGTIFEAVLTSKLTQEVDRLESEYASNLEDEVKEINDDLVEKVNAYLDYVVENWMKENELAVSNGLRTEIAEEFMTSLQQVFKEHYIEVPEGKVDLVDELNEQVNELEETLNKTTEDNVKLHSEVSDYRKQEIVREQSSGLAETEAEKLASLVEDVEFEDSETFETKVKTIRDSYFKSEVNESVDEVDSLLGEDNADESVVSESMARYTQAINKHIS
jgi:cell division protein FtsB